MVFGMPMAVFPALAEELGGGGALLGLLYAAPAAGASLATASSGWAARVRRRGRAVVLAAAAFGVAIVALGVAPTAPLALLFLAAAGAADAVSMVLRGVIWSESVPDELRGRLAALEQLSYASGPALGNAEAGVAAALFGLRPSIVLGGAACVAGVAVAAARPPALWRYDAARVAA
jgi:MFS family permease